MKHKKLIISLVIIFIIIACFCGWIFYFNKSSETSQQQFHSTDYMSDQSSLMEMFNKKDLRFLKINPQNYHLYSGSRNNAKMSGKEGVISYNDLPYMGGLMVNRISPISSNGKYKIYWSTNNNVTIHINRNGHKATFIIAPLGSKNHTFNEHNLNHQGYFVFSKQEEPQLTKEVEHLRKLNNRMFTKSRTSMMRM